MSEAQAEPRPLRSRLGGLLKTLFALALLAWVAWGLPWSDTLRYVADPERPDVVLEVAGDIVGGWREDAVAFDLAADADLAPGWPAEVRAAAVGGMALSVVRRAEDSAGLEWRPGMPRVFLDLELGGLLAAFAALALGLVFGVTRWWRLLALAGCPSTWRNTLRLSSLGLFFNLIFPGITGGDVPKAVLVVREHPERRADALATVLLDRLVGVWALVFLATSVIWLGGEEFGVLKLPSAGALVAGTVGLYLVLEPGPRRALGLDRLLERLPQGKRLKKLEVAAEVYRGRPGELAFSIALSLANHIAVVGATFAIGRAFGDELGFLSYVGIVPVANLISALPISPGGWGVGEWAYGTLFALMGSAAAIGVAISVTYRLCTVALGLLGGLFLLAPGGRETRREALEASRDVEESAGAD